MPALGVEFRGSDTEHREEGPALVGVVRVRGDDPAGLTGGVVGDGFDVADVGWIGLGCHEVNCRPTRPMVGCGYALPCTVGLLPTLEVGGT